MAPSSLLLATAGAFLFGTTAAHPGMGALMTSLLAHRQATNTTTTTTPALIGDLATLSDADLSTTGAAIRSILLGSGFPEDLSSTYTPPGALNSTACAQDTCCVWSYVSADLAAAMTGDAGRCNDFARGAVRLGFHDAGTFSLATSTPGSAGGATGSILLANECEDRSDNNGLADTCALMRTYYDKYSSYGISMADLIQLASNVATVSCPLGPRVRTFVGRTDVSTPAPTGLLPSAFQSVDSLLSLFADKTITPAALVALVGAHTTSQQRFTNTSMPGAPQDSTPGVWDVAFYAETSSATAPDQVYRFPSDEALARDARTSATWDRFTEDNNGQGPWNVAYAFAYVRLSLLGVYNINELAECTAVLPAQQATFTNPDEQTLAAFVQGKIEDTAAAIGDLLNGDVIKAE